MQVICEEIKTEPLSNEEITEVKKEQKKKKLNLEEYRKRRKNMKPIEVKKENDDPSPLPVSNIAPTGMTSFMQSIIRLSYKQTVTFHSKYIRCRRRKTKTTSYGEC